jgi:hypothetical protein
MKTAYIFDVLYTNDIRQIEVKATSEKEAIEILQNRAKRAYMHIVSVQLISKF